MAIRSNTRQADNAGNKKTGSNCPVCCMDCLYSRLIQYGNNPILADCHKQPQAGNDRFPYQREVARTMRICRMYKYTDEVKEIEKRTAA